MIATSPHKTRVREFYDLLTPYFRDLWGEHLHDGYYGSEPASKEAAQEQLVAYLASCAALPRDARGLDVGCGMGASSVWLAQRLGSRMTGVTLSPVQVEVARELAKRAGVEARFLVADAEALDVPEPFDFVWMVGVLGHLEDQQAFVARSPRLLRDGGRFVLGDWVTAPGLSDRDRAKYVEPVREGMLMPQIASLADYRAWFEASGYRVMLADDIAHATRRTWDEGVRISQVPALYELARAAGRDALGLLRAIRDMRRAMARRLIGYAVVIAEKRGAARR